jgi:hypothetical protein
VLAYNGSDTADTGYGIIINSETRDLDPYEGRVDVLYGGVNWWYSDTTVADDEIHTATLMIPEDDPGSPRLFVDGEEVTDEFDTQQETGPPGEPDTQFGIGDVAVDVHTDPWLKGDIGEELVYDRALSQEERGGPDLLRGEVDLRGVARHTEERPAVSIRPSRSDPTSRSHPTSRSNLSLSRRDCRLRACYSRD